MNQNYEEKYLRVRISKDDLEKLDITRPELNLIKKWIELGRKEEKHTNNIQKITESIKQIDQRFDQIEDKLDRFIKMVGQFTHQTFVATATLQDEIDKEMQACNGGKSTPFMDLIRKRYRQSFNLRDRYFPEFRIKGRLDDPTEEFNERMKHPANLNC